MVLKWRPMRKTVQEDFAEICDQPASRTVTLITCADCGRQATVPFVPTPGRPIYCGLCHQRRRDRARAEASARILRATSVIHDTGKPRSGYFADSETQKQ